MGLCRLLLLVALTVVIGGVGHADPAPTTGVLAGTVIDARGVRLQGVTVVATSPPLLGTRAEITDAQGRFELRDLLPGRYLLTYYVGEGTSTRPGVVVTAGKTQRIAMQIKSTTPIRLPALDVLDTTTTRCASWSGHCGDTSRFETVPRSRTSRW